MKRENTVLNHFFSQYTFNDLLEYKNSQTYCAVVERYVNDAEAENNGQLISCVYDYISKEHRNEYFYQNTLLNKLIISRNRLNTTTALTQLPVGNSKADFILINGKAIVFEIKTELDDFSRLEMQVQDYFKAFNHVCVVTCEKNEEKLDRALNNTSVGIYTLTKRNTLHVEREPIEINEFLDHKTIFKILRKKEQEAILLEFFQQLPNCQPVFYYDACLEWFKRIPIMCAYESALTQLKQRNRIIKSERKYFDAVPYELKSLVYFSKMLQKKYDALDAFLSESYRG